MIQRTIAEVVSDLTEPSEYDDLGYIDSIVDVDLDVDLEETLHWSDDDVDEGLDVAVLGESAPQRWSFRRSVSHFFKKCFGRRSL